MIERNPENPGREAEIEFLLDHAPEELSRDHKSMLTEPDISSMSGNPYLQRFLKSFHEGKTKHCHITARDFLKLSINQPKRQLDHYGTWATSFPRDFCLEISSLLVGKKLAEPASILKKANAGTSFFEKSELWLDKFFRAFKNGTAYETGVIMLGQNGNSTLLSVSIPYEEFSLKNQIKWWKKLSPDSFKNFVGREEILEVFRLVLKSQFGEKEKVSSQRDLDLFGNPIDKSKIAGIFDQNNSQVWWGEATRLNTIISNQLPNSSEITGGPSLAERTVNQMTQQGLKEKLGAHVEKPVFLTGYLIDKRHPLGEAGNQIKLYVDHENWTDFSYFKKKGKKFSGI